MQDLNMQESLRMVQEPVVPVVLLVQKLRFATSLKALVFETDEVDKNHLCEY